MLPNEDSDDLPGRKNPEPVLLIELELADLGMVWKVLSGGLSGGKPLFVGDSGRPTEEILDGKWTKVCNLGQTGAPGV